MTHIARVVCWMQQSDLGPVADDTFLGHIPLCDPTSYPNSIEDSRRDSINLFCQRGGRKLIKTRSLIHKAHKLEASLIWTSARDKVWVNKRLPLRDSLKKTQQETFHPCSPFFRTASPLIVIFFDLDLVLEKPSRVVWCVHVYHGEIMPGHDQRRFAQSTSTGRVPVHASLRACVHKAMATCCG